MKNSSVPPLPPRTTQKIDRNLSIANFFGDQTRFERLGKGTAHFAINFIDLLKAKNVAVLDVENDIIIGGLAQNITYYFKQDIGKCYLFLAEFLSCEAVTKDLGETEKNLLKNLTSYFRDQVISLHDKVTVDNDLLKASVTKYEAMKGNSRTKSSRYIFALDNKLALLRTTLEEVSRTNEDAITEANKKYLATRAKGDFAAAFTKSVGKLGLSILHAEAGIDVLGAINDFVSKGLEY
jgi:hypothetical protein